MPRFALLASLSALTFIAHPAIAQTPPMVTVAQTPAAKLKALFADSDEASLKRNPVNAIFRGDLRYADRLGDYISDGYYNAERVAGESELKRLYAIPRAKLSTTDKIAYDVFEAQTKLTLRGLSKAVLPFTAVRPIDHFNGFQTFYPDFASGQGAAPFKTATDYSNNLKRHRDYIVYLDASIGRFREGLASGVVQPKLIVNNVIDQLDIQIAQGVEASTFYAPVKSFPAGISVEEQSRFKADYAATIKLGIIPAYQRLRAFLKNEYLPKARDGVGLMHMKGGKALYTYMIEANTTLPLTAEYVHNLGLSEVKRIKTGMEAIRIKTGYIGTSLSGITTVDKQLILVTGSNVVKRGIIPRRNTRTQRIRATTTRDLAECTGTTKYLRASRVKML